MYMAGKKDNLLIFPLFKSRTPRALTFLEGKTVPPIEETKRGILGLLKSVI